MGSENKKIAVITPFLAHGGLERVAVTGAEELSKVYDVTMIVFDTFQVDYPYEGKLIDLGVPFYDRSIIKRLFGLFKIIYKLRAIKKREKFELIIVHGELANLAAVFSGSGKHIVVIHEDRFAAIKDIQSKIFSIISKRVYHAKNTQKIVTVSKGIERKFIEKFDLDADRVKTIYNPYDLDRIRKEANVPIKKYAEVFKYDVIISVGRLSEAKGHRYLFEIYQLLLESKHNTKLLILGDGELRRTLIVYAKKLGLKVFSVFDKDVFNEDYDVYFIGFQSNPYQYISRAKLFIMSSIWEGFGNTIVEAMACGIPVISTDCPSGPREIIAPKKQQDITEVSFSEYGVIAPVFTIIDNRLSDKDKQQWYDAIVKLLYDETVFNAYKKVSRERANAFDKREIMLQWKEMIEDCINAEKRKGE